VQVREQQGQKGLRQNQRDEPWKHKVNWMDYRALTLRDPGVSNYMETQGGFNWVPHQNAPQGV
jgi:hypothetical protein